MRLPQTLLVLAGLSAACKSSTAPTQPSIAGGDTMNFEWKRLVQEHANRFGGET